MDGEGRLALRVETHTDASRWGIVNSLNQRGVDGKTAKDCKRLIATGIGTHRAEKGNLRTKS